VSKHDHAHLHVVSMRMRVHDQADWLLRACQMAFQPRFSFSVVEGTIVHLNASVAAGFSRIFSKRLVLVHPRPLPPFLSPMGISVTTGQQTERCLNQPRSRRCLKRRSSSRCCPELPE
jgi:hypothetical protein